jgi:hypothetical protein
VKLLTLINLWTPFSVGAGEPSNAATDVLTTRNPRARGTMTARGTNAAFIRNPRTRPTNLTTRNDGGG